MNRWGWRDSWWRLLCLCTPNNKCLTVAQGQSVQQYEVNGRQWMWPMVMRASIRRLHIHSSGNGRKTIMKHGESCSLYSFVRASWRKSSIRFSIRWNILADAKFLFMTTGSAFSAAPGAKSRFATCGWCWSWQCNLSAEQWTGLAVALSFLVTAVSPLALFR